MHSFNVQYIMFKRGNELECQKVENFVAEKNLKPVTSPMINAKYNKLD